MRERERGKQKRAYVYRKRGTAEKKESRKIKKDKDREIKRDMDR